MTITLENLKNTESRQLLNPESYQNIENLVAYLEQSGDTALAKETALDLASKLEQVTDEMPEDLVAKYLRLMKGLRFFTLTNVSDEEKQRFFEDQLVDALRLEFIDEHSWIELPFSIYFDDEDILKQLRNTALEGLQENQEMIGEENIQLRGENQPKPPTAQNWITDYNRRFPVGPQKKMRTHVEQAEYLTEAESAKRLSSEDKKLLQKILEIYDWLRFNTQKMIASAPPPDQILPEGEHELVSREMVNVVNETRQETDLGIKERKPRPTPPAGKPELPLARKPEIKAPPVPSRAEGPVRPEPPVAPRPPRKTEEQPRRTEERMNARTNEQQRETQERKNLRTEELKNRRMEGQEVHQSMGSSVHPSHSDELYKSTLEELNKMRRQYERDSITNHESPYQSKHGTGQARITEEKEKREIPPPPKPVREQTKPKPSPAKTFEKSLGGQAPKSEPFSVNEAIVHAGHEHEHKSQSDEDVQEKLEELKNKIEK